MYTNDSALPQFVYDALVFSDYDRQHDHIGVTSLIDSPRIRGLSRQHPEVVSDAMRNVDVVLGSALHAWIANSNRNQAAIVEQRFTTLFDSVVISGQPDRVEDGVLYDIKTAKAASVMYGIKPSWERQTNVYRWLLEKNGITVNTISIVAIYKDWSIGERKRMLQSEYIYPDNPVEIIPIKTWDMAAAEEYVASRVAAHTTAELPECTAEERWAKEATYAVHKGKKYRAERVLPTRDEAYKWAGEQHITIKRVTNDRLNDEYGYYIVERPEVWTRCEHYCPVRDVCSQYQTYLATSST